jgi:hypothetical protein
MLRHSILEATFRFSQETTVLVQRSEGRFRDTRTLLCDQRVATLDEAEVFFE